MIFRQLFDRESSTYTYLLACPETKCAVLIDPVFEKHQRDLALIKELGLWLKYTLETHVHADHITGGWLMKKALGSEIVLAKASGAEGADHYVDHGDELTVGEMKLEVRSTPGHTDGCITLVTADHKMAFTGDALLVRGAGRTDFQQGSAKTLFKSITSQLFTLPDDCLLYPAHDYQGRTVTSVREEKQFNPRVGGDASEGDFVGYMDNLNLPHPKKIDAAVPANMKCGKPDGDAPLAPAWGPVERSYAGVPEIDATWVSEHIGALQVIDVRDVAEYEGELGHIEGAQLIPLDQLRERIDEVSRDRPIITVCRSGKRSAQAAAILERAGAQEVANLTGGMIRWRALGLPVAGEKAP